MWYYVAVAVAVAFSFLTGAMCYKLASKKGYDGYFWTGFFLNVIGLIYVAGLPASSNSAALPPLKAEPVKYETAETAKVGSLFAKAVLNTSKTKITCMNCGKEQPSKNDICEKCGAAFVRPFM